MSFVAMAELFLLDGDGVLYEEDGLLPGVAEFVAELEMRGVPFALVTNNSTATLDQLVAKMARLGLPQFTAARILTSAYEAVAVMRPTTRTAYIVGMDGIFDACRRAGVAVANADDDNNAGGDGFVAAHAGGAGVDTVFVGLDREVTYAKLGCAMAAIGAGAAFVATNTDPQFPTAGGRQMPGGGAIVAAVATAVGQEPRVIGKPEPHIFHRAMEAFGVADGRRVVMVGDRIDTDIRGGNRAGVNTVLVRTGIAGALLRANQPLPRADALDDPTLIVDDIPALTALLGPAPGAASKM